MAELPSGTVTFLFTDVEGSTRLLQELGAGYAEALAEHRRRLRAAFTRHGGVEVDTQGDAFFVAFERAADALAAAAAAREALEQGLLQVRMAVHTGEPVATREGYVGIDVHRAARIASAGHGGQILVSQSTRDLVGGDGLRDLGEHRLKDLTMPERIYQLGDGDFPPLKSLNQTNLPVPAEPLLGRKKELADALRLIASDGVRLVTVTGPGGVGKTRFALEVAAELVEEFTHGVWFVGLAAVRDPELVVLTVASALGAKGKLEDDLRDRRLLLLLDNLEHVVEAAGDLAALQRTCPGVVLLVTSRERLQIAGEREYPLQALPESAAVELFRQRARSVVPDFEGDHTEIAEVCRQIDGLPLAIELAAARVKLLPPNALLERLDRLFPLLGSRRRDVDHRHQTLRATVEWSYELLDEDEKRLFRRLGVFAGSFDVDAAEQICGADLDLLQSLLEKSLVRRAHDERFVVLATIREFALEMLISSNEADLIRQQHDQYFLRLIERADFAAAEQAGWLDRLEVELDNIRTVLRRAVEAGSVDPIACVAATLSWVWGIRGYAAEGCVWLTEVLACLKDARLRAEVIRALTPLLVDQGHLEQAREVVEERLRIATELGDDLEAARCLNNLGAVAQELRELDAAHRLYEQGLSLSRKCGEPDSSITLNNLARVALERRDRSRAKDFAIEALTAAQRQEDPELVGAVYRTLARVALLEGDERGAARHLTKAVALARTIGDRRSFDESLRLLAVVHARAGRRERGVKLLSRAAALREAAGIGRTRPSPPEEEEVLGLLGGDPLAGSWNAGRSLSLEQALDLALQDLDPVEAASTSSSETEPGT